jgi:hypothetical protein
MRQLRFVALAEDGGSALLETTDGGERFALPVDAALRDALRADLPRLIPHAAAAPAVVPAAAPASAPVSEASVGEAPAAGAPVAVAPVAAAAPPAPPAPDPIGPREIQMRMRAGESPEELAAATGMSLDRVLRFAGAVMDERRRIADEARRARARRSGDSTDAKIVVFGEAVDQRFGAHGIDPESITWDARRREDGEWLITASWRGGDSTHTAEWLFSRSGRSVAPMDDTAADLLSDRPIRPVAPPQPVRPSLVAAPPLAPGVVAFPPMPDAHTGPVPIVEEVFDQEAPAEGPRSVPPLVPAATLSFDEPPLPLGITEPVRPTVRNLGVSRREESEEDKAARARIPSWDDILLGIRRKD